MMPTACIMHTNIERRQQIIKKKWWDTKIYKIVCKGTTNTTFVFAWQKF